MISHRVVGIEVDLETDTEVDNEHAQASLFPSVGMAVEAFPSLRASRKVAPEEYPVLAKALASSVAGMPSDLHLASGRAIQEADSMAVRTAVAAAA
jgi:hypothetical protein